MGNRRSTIVVILALLVMTAACAKPLVRGNTRSLKPVSRSFPTGANAVYYALRWALSARDYPVGYENLHDGIISTAWVPTRADSHYVELFQRQDYGTVGAYHQLEIRVIPVGGGTKVSVVSRVKSLVRNIHSSGREEKAVLDEVANYLHGREVQVTNVGVVE